MLKNIHVAELDVRQRGELVFVIRFDAIDLLLELLKLINYII